MSTVLWRSPSSPCKWVVPTLLLPGFAFRCFRFVNPFRQFTKLVRRDQIVVDHAYEQILDGASAKSVNDSPYLLRRHVVRLDARAVNVCPAFDVMLDIPFFFQATENRADS